MAASSHLPEFMEYIGRHSDMKPDKTFDAMAGEAAVPPWPAPFPLGDVFLYPEFLAFLTTRMFSRGVAGFGEELAYNVKDYTSTVLKVHRWAIHSASALYDIAKAVNNKYQGEQVLTKALTNKHSLFIPLSRIRDVKTGGGYSKAVTDGWKEAFRSPYITITTDETNYVLYQPIGLSAWNVTNIKRGYNAIMSKWHTDVVQLLEAKAQANKKV